jgi:hypothetical protein
MLTPGSDGRAEIEGPWEFHAQLVVQKGQDLPLPPAVNLGDTVYTFTSVHATPSVIEVKWAVTGGAVDRAYSSANCISPRAVREPPQSLPSKQPGSIGPAPSVVPFTPPSAECLHQMEVRRREGSAELLDPRGHPVEPVSAMGVLRAPERAYTFNGIFPRTTSGIYRIRVTEAAVGQFERSIHVP